MPSKTLVRADASPVSQPTQYGEDADSARKCGTYWHSALTIGIAFSGDADADVHVDAEDLQPPGEPLHPLDQLQVALLGRDQLASASR